MKTFLMTSFVGVRVAFGTQEDNEIPFGDRWGHPEAARVRETVPEWKKDLQTLTETDESKIKELAKCVKVIMNISELYNVRNEEEFTKAFADADRESDNITRGLGVTIAQKTDKMYLAEAAQTLSSNDCRAFTGYNGMMYFRGEPELSDHVHECIHVLCKEQDRKTGMSKFEADFGKAFLEGVTQHLTVRVCKFLGIDVNPAYPGLERGTKALVTEYGLRLVYNAYFKGETEALIQPMVNNYKQVGWSGRTDQWKSYHESVQNGVGTTWKVTKQLFEKVILPWVQTNGPTRLS